MTFAFTWLIFADPVTYTHNVIMASKGTEFIVRFLLCKILQVESNWTSVAFNIPRQATIPSDNTEHKVAIVLQYTIQQIVY